jgi:hypothetical protein
MAAGAAETIIHTLSRARWPVLIAFAIATAVAVLELSRNHPPQIEMVARISIVLLGAAAIGFVHLRHFWLAALAAFAPLPGLLVAIAVTGEASATAANYTLGLIVALFAADAFAMRSAQGVPADEATRGAFEDFGAAAVAIFAVALFIPFVLHWAFGEISRSAFAASASVSAAGLIVPLAASALIHDENFVTRFNRTREREERLVTPLLAVAHARWGASIAGVAAVVCVLGYFGSWASHIVQNWQLALTWAVLCAVAAFWTSRDWRRTIAMVLSLVPVVLMALWTATRLRALVGGGSSAIVILGGFALVLFVASTAARYARSGNGTAMASARAMERKSGVVVTAALASIFAIAAGTSNSAVFIVMFVFSTVAAVLFQPALAISIETLFPRRETIEARYRVR